MDFTKPVNAATKTSAAPKRGWGRTVLVWVSLAAALLIMGVLCLPMLCSTGWVQALVVNKLNQQLAPASISVGTWSFRWFGEQRIEQIVFCDPTRGVSLNVKQLRANSLWALLPMGHVTAEIFVETPEVSLTKPAANTTPPIEAPQSEMKGAQTESPTIGTPIIPAWALSTRLHVSEAVLRMAGAPEPLLTQGALEMTIPAWDQPIAVQFQAQVIGAETKAEAILPALTACLQQLGTPWVNTARLDVKARWGQGSLQLSAPSGRRIPNMQAKLSLNLAQALAAARYWNVLQAPEVILTQGTATLTASLKDGPGTGLLSLSSALRTEALALSYNGKPIQCSPQVNLSAVFDPNNPLTGSIERLSIDLPGLIASGSGSLEAGELSAWLKTETLLDTFGPFLGGLTLAQPLDLRLDAKAASGSGSLKLTAVSGQTAVGSLEATATGISLASHSVQALKVSAQADLAQAVQFVSHPEGWQVAGTGLLHASASGSLEAFRAKLLFALRDAAFSSAAWNVQTSSLLEGEASLHRTAEGALECSEFSMKAPFLTAVGKASLPRGANLPTLTLEGSLTPANALRWRRTEKDTSLPEIQGELAYTFACTSDKTPQINLRLSSENLQIQPSGCPALALPFTLTTTALLAEEPQLNTFSLTSAPLAIEAKGHYVPKTGTLSLEGSLTPDFAAIWALPCFTTYRESGFGLSGRHTTPFQFKAPILNGSAGLFNYGKGEASVQFDQITVPGLNIPGGEAKLTLSEAVAALDGTFNVNGGNVFLSPRLNLSVQPYTLTFPDNTELLRGVQLTQELLDTGLKAVNPLLPGSASPAGALHVRSRAFRMTLDDRPLASLSTILDIQTEGCRVKPNGTLGSILGLLRARERVISMPDQTFTVTVEEGKLVCEPIQMQFSGAKLECSGTTDLTTREVDYVVVLPLTRQLLGDRLSKRIGADQTLRLPIRGTVDNPKPDTAPLVALLRDSLVGRVTEKLSNRLGKALQKSGEAGLEVGGAAHDVAKETLDAVGNGSDTVKLRLEEALRNVFKSKRNN